MRHLTYNNAMYYNAIEGNKTVLLTIKDQEKADSRIVNNGLEMYDSVPSIMNCISTFLSDDKAIVVSD